MVPDISIKYSWQIAGNVLYVIPSLVVYWSIKSSMLHRLGLVWGSHVWGEGMGPPSDGSEFTVVSCSISSIYLMMYDQLARKHGPKIPRKDLKTHFFNIGFLLGADMYCTS